MMNEHLAPSEAKQSTRIALLQMVSGKTLDANFATVQEHIEKAAGAGAEILMLPENFAAMGLRANSFAENLGDGPYQLRLQNLAQRYKMNIIAGSFPVKASSEQADDHRVYTSSLCFDASGELVEHYHKIHLFDVNVGDSVGRYQESLDFIAGDDVKTVKLAGLHIGLSICYDLRFPELYRQLVAKGAELLFVPAAFTYTTGQAHWQALLQARAIENTAFVAAVNQAGTHSKGRKTWGHSMVLDPWGEVLTQGEFGEQLLLQTIDLARLQQIRENLPSLTHRRLY